MVKREALPFKIVVQMFIPGPRCMFVRVIPTSEQQNSGPLLLANTACLAVYGDNIGQ